MHDLGPVTHYVGFDIERDWSTGTLFISQQTYITEIMNGRVIQSPPVSSPMSKKSLLANSGKATESEITQYQQDIGALSYLQIGSRADTAYAIGILSQFSANPSAKHIKALDRLFSYVKHTAHYRLTYKGPINCQGFSDANLGGPNHEFFSAAPHSRFGYVFTMAGGAISWRSKKQMIIAGSSFAAEVMALTSTSQKALWLGQLLSELGNPQVLPVYTDNDSAVVAIHAPSHDVSQHISAIYLLEQNRLVDRIPKHVNVSFWSIKEFVDARILKVAFKPAKEMVADIFTKPLFGPAIQLWSREMGLY